MLTLAIIIKKQNTNEYDQLISCYTKELGKITAIAKSILKHSSVQAMHLDVLNLVEFDLVDAANRIVKTYSGGMRRRLDLSASLIATPPILFLDEPTTGLDPRSRLKIWEIISRLLKEGATILLTTQYLEEADKLADKIAVLDQGKIIAFGTASELKSKVGDDRLEMTVSEESDFDKAKQLILADSGFANEEGRVLSIATNGSVQDIKRILDTMDHAGIKLETFASHKPTLDDVFIHLARKAGKQ